jgi:hypothetical protein
MGVRGELFSTRIILPNRTYFFNVKENRMGDLYLNIVESKNRDNGGFERQSVILFADDLQEFLKGFDESLRVLEKAVREKRRGGASKRVEKEGHDETGSKKYSHKGARNTKVQREDKGRQSFSGEKPARSRKSDRAPDNKPRGSKRIVVKKR